MNMQEYKLIPGTKGRYGINVKKVIADLERKKHITVTGKYIKIWIDGKRTVRSVDKLFRLTYGDNPNDSNIPSELLSELMRVYDILGEQIRKLKGIENIS